MEFVEHPLASPGSAKTYYVSIKTYVYTFGHISIYKSNFFYKQKLIPRLNFCTISLSHITCKKFKARQHNQSFSMI